jgi:hypothetical protein
MRPTQRDATLTNIDAATDKLLISMSGLHPTPRWVKLYGHPFVILFIVGTPISYTSQWLFSFTSLDPLRSTSTFNGGTVFSRQRRTSFQQHNFFLRQQRRGSNFAYLLWRCGMRIITEWVATLSMTCQRPIKQSNLVISSSLSLSL